MNDSSGNNIYSDKWTECLDKGYVALFLYHAAQALCFLLGTPALVWCLWISLSGSLSGGLKPTQVFPINLLVVELALGVEGPIEIVNYLIVRHNTILLKVVYSFYYFCWTCRPLVQTCICVERYLAVAQPVTFLKYRLRRYRVGTSTLIWGFSLAYSCLTSLFSVKQDILGNVLLGVYCLGVVFISLCCFFILRVLKQPGPGDVEGGRGGERQQGTKDPQKMRAFRIILTNLVIIVVSSISVVVGWATFRSSLDFYCNVSPIFWTVTILSVLVSPFLHLHREGRLPCRRDQEAN